MACFIKWSTQLKQAVTSLITALTDAGVETVSATEDAYFVFVWLTICEDIIAWIASITINFITRVCLFI